MAKKYVLTDEETRCMYSADFSEIQIRTAIAVVRPRQTQEIVSIVKAAKDTGVALTARGGDMSYTLGIRRATRILLSLT